MWGEAEEARERVTDDSGRRRMIEEVVGCPLGSEVKIGRGQFRAGNWIWGLGNERRK